MEKSKSRNNERQEKRWVRMSSRRSSILSTDHSTAGSIANTSTFSSIATRLTWRESRKRSNREGTSSTDRLEVGYGSSTPAMKHGPDAAEEPATALPNTDEGDNLEENQTESMYSLPGAFRVSRKMGSLGQVDEMTLGEESLESYLTTKTRPVVIPDACLVPDGNESVVEKELPVALPQSNVLLVTKRHVFICVALSCIAFGGLFTGLLFSLWQRPTDSAPSNELNMNLQDGLSPSPSPTLKVYDGVLVPTQNTEAATTRQPTPSQTLRPSRSNVDTQAPTKNPTNSPTVSASGTNLDTTAPTNSPTVSSTRYPTRSPTPAPTGATDNPASIGTSPPTLAPVEFSLTSRPVSSSIASPAYPGNGNGNYYGFGNGNGNGNGGNN